MLYFVPSANLVDAACRNISEEQKRHFFKDSAEAKKICRGCTVRKECLAQALAFGAEGVWGGTTYTERKRLTE